MLVIKIVKAGNEPNENLNACKSIMRDQHFEDFTEEIDLPQVMKLTRGWASPTNGFVIIITNVFTAERDIILSFFDLVKYIEDNGLRDL